MRSRFLKLGLAAAFAGAACSEPTANDRSVVVLALATQAPGLAAQTAAGFSLGANMAGADTTILGTDTVIVTSAELVLSELALEGAETEDCDQSEAAGSALVGSVMTGDDDGDADAEDDGNDDGDDRCEQLSAGPQLFALPLEAGAVPAIEITVQPGTYDELEFEIHQPNENDQDFLTQNPDFADVSIRIQGTYNGEPFDFETGLSAAQEVAVEPPLVVDQPGTTTVVLVVDLSAFFVNSAGTGLVDPNSANAGGPNESLVHNNIEGAFEGSSGDD